jgi:hypothetical protein
VVEGVRQTGRVVPLPILQAQICKFRDTPSPTPPSVGVAPILSGTSALEGGMTRPTFLQMRSVRLVLLTDKRLQTVYGF